MTILFLIILGTVAAFLAWAFVRGGTRKPTPQQKKAGHGHWYMDTTIIQIKPPLYEMRYRGGHPICRICGESTEYSDNYGPVHPYCRGAS